MNQSIGAMGEITAEAHQWQIEQMRSLGEYRSELTLQLYFGELEKELRELPGAYSPPGGQLSLSTLAGQPIGWVGLRRFPLEGAR